MQLKIEEITDRPDTLMVKSRANSKFTGAIAYKKTSSGEAGSGGFIVLKGDISVKNFELSFEKE